MSLVYRFLQNTVNRDDVACITFNKLYVICYNISANFVTRCDWTLDIFYSACDQEAYRFHTAS